MYVQPSKLKSMLTLGDFFVKKESGKYNVYRCSYSNSKKWFLGKLFSDDDPNNSIQLTGNYKVEKNFTSALKTIIAIRILFSRQYIISNSFLCFDTIILYIVLICFSPTYI